MENLNKKSEKCGSLFDKIGKIQKDAVDQEKVKQVIEELKKFSPSNEKIWSTFIRKNDKTGKLFADMSKSYVEVKSSWLPIPMHYLTKNGKTNITRMFLESFDTMCTLNGILSFVMFTPSLLIALSTTPSHKNINDLNDSLKKLNETHEKYVYDMVSSGKMNEKQAYESKESMNMIENARELIMFKERELKQINNYEVKEWDFTISSTEVISQYKMIKNLLSVTNCFSSERVISTEYARRIRKNEDLFQHDLENISKSFYSKFDIQEFIDQIEKNGRIHDYSAIDHNKFYNVLVQNTFNVIKALEKWFLRLLGVDENHLLYFHCNSFCLPNVIQDRKIPEYNKIIERKINQVKTHQERLMRFKRLTSRNNVKPWNNQKNQLGSSSSSSSNTNIDFGNGFSPDVNYSTTYPDNINEKDIFTKEMYCSMFDSIVTNYITNNFSNRNGLISNVFTKQLSIVNEEFELNDDTYFEWYLRDRKKPIKYN